MANKTMDLFRSEEMQLLQLMIPAEAAHDTIAALGEVGMLQFKDLNQDKSAFQKTYANQVRRCDEMARKLRFFTDQVTKSDVVMGGIHSSEKAYELDELEAKLDELEVELLEINANNERLQRSHGELVELQLVLEKAGAFFEDAASRASAARFNASSAASETEMGAPLLSEPASTANVRLGFVSGTVQSEKLAPFERLLFRATRGNMFLRHTAVGQVTDPTTNEKVEKSVFVVFFAGERARTKILKICEAYGANRYPFPEETTRQRQMNAEVTGRLRELHTTIEAGERHRESVLQGISNNLPAWTSLVKREKAVYHTLNKLSIDTSRKVLVAEAWCPIAYKARVTAAVRQAQTTNRGTVGTIIQPMVTNSPEPTYFSTNKYTSAFQMIVDAYGVARYREVNPAVFTIVTFPFLFAVMFGDIGHAALMLMFALFLVLNEKKFMSQQLNEMVDMAFGGRYVILFMSLFSVYTGFIYNECFSVPFAIFGRTRFGCETNLDIHNRVDIAFAPELCPSATSTGFAYLGGTPYPFGVDPVWHSTRTELQFLNSVKMKMSIILGVIQMNLGIIMSLFNQRYFRDTLSTIFEFIPQMIFLNALFGYLCVLLLLKWATGSTADLYHVMIYMFLQPGDVTCGGDCQENMMYPGQSLAQVVFVLGAILMIPLMLLPKPLILRARHRARMGAHNAAYGQLSSDDEAPAASAPAPAEDHGHDAHGHGDHFDFGELMVHQMIHTIEFVLGAVSNTASYLRLWALSLAHSQLSAVFYDRVLLTVMKLNSPIFMVIGFFIFAMATLGVLMVMETLSAFLHALRLHWVEFQNKFYHGDGYQFTPFSFEAVDKEEL